MPGTDIQDLRSFDDVVQLLESHPEWLVRLRPLLFTKELLALPEHIAHLTEQVGELAGAQRHTEQQMVLAQARTDALFAELAEAQHRTEQRLTELAEAQHRTEQRLTELAEAQRHTDQQIAALVLTVQGLSNTVQGLTDTAQRLTDEVGKGKGKALETHYRIHGSPFFGILLRRPQVLSMGDLTDLLDAAVEQGALGLLDVREIQRADVIVNGIRREDGATVYLVVEVSWSVDTGDVERAARRAASLAKTGLPVLPVVAGEIVRPGAAELAQKLRVWQVTDSDVVAPAA
jgi:hypothetical protein